MSKDSFAINDTEWAENLQKGLEEYMFSLYENLDNGEEEDIETESFIAFCGCGTCEVREILAYVTPRIIRGYLERRVDLV